MKQITYIDQDMSWDDFQKKFWKFFPISSEPLKLQKLREEYKRLTGKDPEYKKQEPKHGKAKRVSKLFEDDNSKETREDITSDHKEVPGGDSKSEY